MKLTHEIIDAGASRNGGWSGDQLAVFGIKFPLKKGWKSKLAGTDVSDDQVKMFLHLKDAHLDNDEFNFESQNFNR